MTSSVGTVGICWNYEIHNRWKNKKRSKSPTSHPKIASNTCIVGLQIVHQLLFVCENAQATQQPLQIVDFLRIEAPNPSLPHFCPYAYLDIYIYICEWSKYHCFPNLSLTKRGDLSLSTLLLPGRTGHPPSGDFA